MSKVLWIAEKPSVGSAVATALGGGVRKGTHIDCGKNIVTWALGHLLQSQAPEKYNPDYKQWRLESLPLLLFPTVYEPTAGREAQVSFIGQALKDASLVMNCCDIDDEGALIFEELMEYFDYRGEKKRVLISDLSDDAVLKAVQNPRKNEEFYGQYLRAYARSAADEVFGLSMSRALTVAAKKTGYSGKPLTVGRVQTPTMGLVADRYLANKGHTKSHYYTLSIIAKNENGQEFKAGFVPDDRFALDENGRMINKGILQSVYKLIENSKGEIDNFSIKDELKSAPLPYSLARLQSFMNRKFKFTAQKTLDLTQVLREEFKAITYNRSDCSYLSSEQHEEAGSILSSMQKISGYANFSLDPSLKSRAFNDANVSAHTAIVPTGQLTDLSVLSADLRDLYLAICDNYVAQFMGDQVIKRASGTLKVHDYNFKFSGGNVTLEGWNALFKAPEKAKTDDDSINSFEALESLAVGDVVTVSSAALDERETKPPKLFTEDTLITAMTRIADYVKNENIKSLLKEKDEGLKGEHGSIGTSATRSSIIERLKKSGYIEVVKGNLIPTENALVILKILPRKIVDPDLTALWFQQQNLISENKLSIKDFIDNIYTAISSEVESLSQCDFSGLIGEKKEIIHCPNCNSEAKIFPKLIACRDPSQKCEFKVWRTIAQKQLTDKQLVAILENGESGFIKGFVSKAKGTKFEANLVLKNKETGQIEFKFKPRSGKV